MNDARFLSTAAKTLTAAGIPAALVLSAMETPIGLTPDARARLTHELRMAREEHYLMEERCANGILRGDSLERRRTILGETRRAWEVASTRYRLHMAALRARREARAAA